MSSFEAGHPLGADIALVSDALKAGVGDVLPFWGMMKGFDITVFPEEIMEDHSTYVRMEMPGGQTVIEYKMAPTEFFSNPLAVIEADENGDIVAKSALARMVVSSSVLLMPLFEQNGKIIKTSLIQVDVLPEGAVVSASDALGLNPEFGEYEGEVYDLICRKSYNELKLGYMVGWARDYLNAA